MDWLNSQKEAAGSALWERAAGTAKYIEMCKGSVACIRALVTWGP